MSYLHEVQNVSAGHYVLPKLGSMRTEVHAYLSEAMYPVANIKGTD